MSDDLDDFRAKERIKQEMREEEYKTKKQDREAETKKNQTLEDERQQLRANINADEFDRRNQIKLAEKNQDLHLKNQSEAHKNEVQRINHVETLTHTTELSEQEHHQQITLEAKRHQQEIEILNGKLKAEQGFIQERNKGEIQLQQNRDLAELERAELLAKYDYKQALETQQEITIREITIVREQTYRELALARENNNQELVLEKLKHLSLLEQKSQELKHYKARTQADSEALTLKEDQALDRRLTESRHTFGQDIQKLHAEHLRMKLENKLKKELFTHEQETLLRMRKLAKDFGLDYAELSAGEIADMVAEFERDLSSDT